MDANGWRVGKKVDGVVQQRRIYGRSLEVLAELGGAGQVASRFVFLNPLGSAAYLTKAGHTYRIISDHLSSARIVVDATSGEIVQRLDYDAWGQILQDSNPGFQPFGYAGREFDPETGLVYMRARYYSPGEGRFVREDPIGFRGGMNRFAYVRSNPVNLVDPSGLVDLNLLNSAEQRAGDAYKSPEGVFSVAAHSIRYADSNEPFAFDDQRALDPNQPHVQLSAAQLAAKIRNTAKWKSGKIKRVLLLSCNVGTGKNSLAQQLANELGVPVTGVSGGRAQWDPRLADDEYGGWSPAVEDDAMYRTFPPDRRR